MQHLGFMALSEGTETDMPFSNPAVGFSKSVGLPGGIDTVFNTITLPAGPGFGLTRGPFLVNTYQSWQIQIANTAGVPSTLGVEFIWSIDAQMGLGVYALPVNITKDEYWEFDFALGNVGDLFTGTGPHYGNYLSIRFTNYDVTTKTFNYQLWGTNPVAPPLRSSIRLNNPSANAELSGFGADDILLNDSQAVATGTNGTKVLLKFYNGPVTITMNTGTATAASSILAMMRIEPASVFTFDFARVQMNVVTTGEANLIAQLYLPKRTISYTPRNSSSGNTLTVHTTIIANGANP